MLPWEAVVAAQAAQQAAELVKLTTKHKKDLHQQIIRSHSPSDPAHQSLQGRCICAGNKLTLQVLRNGEEDFEEKDSGITLASFLHRAGLKKKESLSCIQVRVFGTDGTDEAHWKVFAPSQPLLHPDAIRLQEMNIHDIYRQYSGARNLQLFRCCRWEDADNIKQKKAIVPRSSRPLIGSALEYIKAMWSHVENGTRAEPFISSTKVYECALWHSMYGLLPLLEVDGQKMMLSDRAVRCWDFSKKSVREAIFAPTALHRSQRTKSSRSQEVLVDRPIPATAYTRIRVTWKTKARYVSKPRSASSSNFPLNFDFINSNYPSAGSEFEVLEVMPDGISQPLHVRYLKQQFIMKRGIGHEQGGKQDESAAQKWNGNSRQTSSEFFALLCYRALGVEVPDAAFYQCVCYAVAYGKQRTTRFCILLTRYVQDQRPSCPLINLRNLEQLKQHQQIRAEFVKGFAADVLLSNADAAGPEFKNLIVLQPVAPNTSPTVIRVDAGGCLGYTARGNYHYFKRRSCEEDYDRLTDAVRRKDKQVCTNSAWCRYQLTLKPSGDTILEGLTIDADQFKQIINNVLDSTGSAFFPPEWMDNVDIIAVRITRLQRMLSPATAIADDAEELLSDSCVVCRKEVFTSAQHNDHRYGFQCDECENFQHSRCIGEMDKECQAHLCHDCILRCARCGLGGCLDECLVHCDSCYNVVCNPGNAVCGGIEVCESTEDGENGVEHGTICFTCAEAFRSCAICGRRMCADHIVQCDDCMQMVCTDEDCEQRHRRRDFGMDSDDESDSDINSSAEDTDGEDEEEEDEDSREKEELVGESGEEEGKEEKERAEERAVFIGKSGIRGTLSKKHGMEEVEQQPTKKIKYFRKE